MRTKVVLLLLVFVSIYAACSSSKESTGVWVNKEKIQGKTFQKLFIVVMTADIEARAQLESDLAVGAQKRGYETIKSIDVMPPSLSDPKLPEKEALISVIKASGCDAVFVASLLQKEEAIRFTPGSTAYSMKPYYSWGGSYPGYYSYWHPTVSTSGYYSNDKSYFMLSNLYDAATEEIMCSVQSEIFNPTSLKSFSKAYTSRLIEQLESEKLLRKNKS